MTICARCLHPIPGTEAVHCVKLRHLGWDTTRPLCIRCYPLAMQEARRFDPYGQARADRELERRADRRSRE